MIKTGYGSQISMKGRVNKSSIICILNNNNHHKNNNKKYLGKKV